MELTEEDFQFDWDCWGDTKPWYCHKCDSLLASDQYKECDGTDPGIPKDQWNPHPVVAATSPVDFEQFCNIQRRWEKQNSPSVEEPEKQENEEEQVE